MLLSTSYNCYSLVHSSYFIPVKKFNKIFYKLHLKTYQIKGKSMNIEKYASSSNLHVTLGVRSGFHTVLWIPICRCYFGQCFPLITLKSYLEGSDTHSRSRSNSISILHVPLEARSASKCLIGLEDSG